MTQRGDIYGNRFGDGSPVGAVGQARDNANKPDKGHKDGSCNVTACQAPLAGTMQGWMVNYTITDGRLYYCERCCLRFNEWDDRIRERRRITWDETAGPRIAGVHDDHA